MNQHKLLFLCPCRQELLSLKSLAIHNQLVKLQYQCRLNNKNCQKELTIFEYFTILYNKQTKENCSFTNHNAIVEGYIFCCICKSWLCKECLDNHNTLLFGHLFSYFDIDCRFTCNCNNNIASLICEDCDISCCKKCSKPHKSHHKMSFINYKEKFASLKDISLNYKTVNSENLAIYKYNTTIQCDKHYHRQYKEYYNQIRNTNEQLYEFIVLFFDNLNYLKNMNILFYNNLKIVSQVEFKRVIPFDEFYRNQHIYHNIFFTVKYAKKAHYAISLKKQVQFKEYKEKDLKKVFGVSENEMLIQCPTDLYLMNIESEKKERIVLGYNNIENYNRIFYLRQSNKFIVIDLDRTNSMFLIWDYNSRSSYQPSGFSFNFLTSFCETKENTLATLNIDEWGHYHITVLSISLEGLESYFCCGWCNESIRKLNVIKDYNAGRFSINDFFYFKNEVYYFIAKHNKLYSYDFETKSLTLIKQFDVEIFACFKISDLLFTLVEESNKIKLFSFDTLTCIQTFDICSQNYNNFAYLIKYNLYENMLNNKVFFFRNKTNTISLINQSTGENFLSLGLPLKNKNSFIGRYNDSTLYFIEKGIISLYHFSD